MKLNKILASFLGSVAIFGAASCTDKVEYEPAPAYKGAEVYFSDDESTDVAIDQDATEVRVYVHRVNDEEDLTVALQSTILDEDGVSVGGSVFTVPTQVTFHAGEKVAAVPIAVVFDEVVPESEYTLDIAIVSDDKTPYGHSNRTYKLSYAPWTEFEVVSETDPVHVTMGYPFTGNEFDQYLFRRNSVLNPNLVQYGVPTPYIDLEFDYIFTVDSSQKVMVDGVECYRIRTPHIDTGYVNGDGNTFVLCDVFTWIKWARSADGSVVTDEECYEWMERTGRGESYFNPITGLAAVDFMCYPRDLEPGLAYNNGYTYFQLPGYKNYSFEFDVLGNMVDKTGKETVVLNIYKSVDIASYAFSIKYGALSEEEVAATVEEIVADSEAILYYDESSNISVPVSEEGAYTIVAVGYDEGVNKIHSDYYTFNYTSVKKESEWVSVGEADYTDGIIPSMFNIDVMTWPVEIEENINTPGLYRIVNPYLEWPINIADGGDDVQSGNYYIILDCTDPDAVTMPECQTGVNFSSQYGMISVVALGEMYVQNGNDRELVKRYGYFGTLEDGVVTFPAGCLLMNMANYNADSWYYANVDPNNPTLADDYPGDYDPFWGEGAFCVEFYDAPARSNKAKAPAIATPQNKGIKFNLNKLKCEKVKKGTTLKARKLSKEEFNSYFLGKAQKLF